MDNALHLIGIAKKAGQLAIGEEPVGAGARAHKARLILLASDAAAATVRRAETFAQAGGIFTLPLAAAKAELGGILGRTSCAMVAIMDAGLAASIAQKIAAVNPEFAEQSAELDRKAKRVNDRRREKRIHDRRVARNAEKPWAGKPKGDAGPKKPRKPKRSSNILVSDVAPVAEKPTFAPQKAASVKLAPKTKFRAKPKQS